MQRWNSFSSWSLRLCSTLCPGKDLSPFFLPSFLSSFKLQVFSRSNRSVLLQFLLFCKKVTPKNFIITKTQLESRNALFNTSNFGLKFRKRNSILRLLRPGPSHRAFGLVILVSRMQKSVTEDNNFVKWTRTFWSDQKKMSWPVKVDHLQRWSRIFRSDRIEMVSSIWFLIEISGILGWMESAQDLK